MGDAPLDVHPEVAALQAENAALRDEIARALARVEYLVHVLRPHLLALYQIKLGPWELEALTLDCEVARLRRKIGLIQAERNLGRSPDLASIEARLEAELLAWKARVTDAAARLDAAQRYMAQSGSPAEVEEVRRLFHLLVRALHPDLHPQQTDVQRVLWHRVMEAYGQGDLEALRTLVVLFESAEAGPDGPGSLERLARERDGLRQRLAQTVDRIQRLEQEPPFTLEDKLADDAWVEARRAEVQMKIAALSAQKAFLEDELGVMMRFGHVPRSGPH